MRRTSAVSSRKGQGSSLVTSSTLRVRRWELGTAVRYVHLDVTDASQWGQAVQTAESEFGPVTLLVNNAGNVAFGGIDSMTPEDFRRVIDSISPGRGLACMRRWHP